MPKKKQQTKEIINNNIVLENKHTVLRPIIWILILLCAIAITGTVVIKCTYKPSLPSGPAEEEMTFDKVKSLDFCVVVFSADWCPDCQNIKPALEQAQTELSNVIFYTVDTSENKEIAKEYGIHAIPTLVILQDGQAVDRLVGPTSYEQIVTFVNQNQPSIS